jgi:ribosomal protein L13E
VLIRTLDDIAEFRRLLDLGVDPRESLGLPTITLPTFFLAARGGQLDAMRALVDKGVDPTFVAGRRTTALTLAAGADRPNLAALRYLLDHGADVNATDADGRTALDWALTRGDTEAAAFLRSAGGRTNAAPTVIPPPRAIPRQAREAITVALTRLQPAGRGFTDRARCVSCHHEYIPGIAVAMAQRLGVAVDGPVAAHSRAAIDENWARRRELMLLGERAPIAGLPPGAGYGLLQRSEAGLGPTPLTDAIVIALANRQLEDGSWEASEGIRPPLNGNVFANTALAARGLREFAPPGHRREIERRVAGARAFLAATPVTDTQDQVFKLLGLIWSDASTRAVAVERQALIALQRRDGGWGQLPTLSSDAYATGQALYALRVAGVAADDTVYRRGADFLLRTQLEDGTWFVKTRAFGVQPYFETGFPHGPSQFISATATAWAAIALTHTLR